MAFVSSRIHDETTWARDAVDEVLERPSFIVPWIFEHTPASSQEVDEGYLEKVRDADLVIWLIETETTDPVRNEITTAVQSSLPILMFRTTQGSSDAPTESLITRVGGKYDRVLGADDLKNKLHLALSDEIVRAWRKAGRSPRPALFSAARAHSRARCIERWLAVGVPLTIAERFADDASIGLLRVAPFASNRFAVLMAEMGAGKSLAAERVFLEDLGRAEKTGGNVPIFLDAKEVPGTIAAHLERINLGTMSATPDLIVIDGLDEAPVGRRSMLAREALRMTLAHRSLRVLVTCRPLPELSPTLDSFVVDLEPLSEEESLTLISQVSENRVSKFAFFDFPKSFLEAIRRPLFAILAGVTQREQTLTPLPQGRLLEKLVLLSLGRTNAHRESADPLLRKLARLTMDGGGPSVPTAEIGTYAEVAPLLRSRLVVERDGHVRFALVILAEWFAARELEVGAPDPDAITESRGRLHQWRVPLQMCLSTTSEAQVSRLMQPLASRHPGIATQLVDHAFPHFMRSESDYMLPSWQECGDRLADAMRAWTVGLGPLGRLVAPMDDDGRLRTLGVRKYDRGLLFSWGGSDNVGRVLQLPDNFSEHAEWRDSTVVWRSEVHNGWAWLWTQEYLRDKIVDLLESRALPLLEALYGERTWRTAVRIVGRLHPWKIRAIPKAQLVERCRQIGLALDQTVRSDGKSPPILDEIRDLVSQSDRDHIDPPWPGPDEAPGPYAWSGYRHETIVSRTRAVYTAALQAYFEAVNRWFPSFVHDLRMISKGPRRIVGVIRRSRGPNYSDGGLGLDYYWESCSEVSEISADIRWADENECAEFGRDRRKKLETGVIDSFGGSVLDVFDLDAAERLTYSWLEDDLRRLHWA